MAVSVYVEVYVPLANGVEVHQSHLMWRQVATNISITPLEH